MGVIEEVYTDLETDLEEEEFREAVESKVEQLAGLADEETAAMLVAHELEADRVLAIDDIEPEMQEAKFLAKVRSVGELRTFERDEEDEEGHVINVEAVDETGKVRLAFWDEQAQAIDAEGLEPGTVLRVKGRPKDGFAGLEVSVHHAEPDPDAEIDVDLSAPDRIEGLSLGQDSVRLRGRVLDTDPPRTFERDDGSEGRVGNLVIGDETGRVRITLWDDRAEQIDEFSPGESIEVDGGYVRERDDQLECHVGDRGTITHIEDDIEFVPETTPIAELETDDVVDIAGVIRSTDGKRTFDRDDGSTGQVRNVRVQDESGDIRVAIWGDAADRDLAPGDTVWFGNVDVRDGWQDDLEVSVGWQSTIAQIDLDAVRVTPTAGSDGDEHAEGSAQLSAFEDETPATGEGERVDFTGTVVQTGTPVIVDDGEEAVRVETDVSLTLGQEVTVSGTRHGDRIDAEGVVPADGVR